MADMNKPAPPRHIAIIMDGNGRWAKKRGLPRTAGHAAGAETFRKIANYCRTLGVEYLTVYAFSTENWRLPAILLLLWTETAAGPRSEVCPVLPATQPAAKLFVVLLIIGVLWV